MPPSSPSSGMPSAKEKGRALTPLDLSPLPLDQDPFGFAPVPDDEDMYMSRPMTPPVPMRGPTPPVFGENPVTPRHIQHPLGWQRVSSRERAAVDENQQLKWVPQGHTPGSFHKSRTQASNPFAIYDPGWAPASGHQLHHLVLLLGNNWLSLYQLPLFRTLQGIWGESDSQSLDLTMFTEIGLL